MSMLFVYLSCLSLVCPLDVLFSSYLPVCFSRLKDRFVDCLWLLVRLSAH